MIYYRRHRLQQNCGVFVVDILALVGVSARAGVDVSARAGVDVSARAGVAISARAGVDEPVKLCVVDN